MELKDIREKVDSTNVTELLKTLDEESIIAFLRKSELVEKCKLKSTTITRIIISLSDRTKQAILEDVDLIQKELNLTNFNVTSIISSLQENQAKSQVMELYQFKRYEQMTIWKSFTDESKTNMVLTNSQNFRRQEFCDLIRTLSVEALVEFIKDNKEFLKQNGIDVFELSMGFSDDKQKEFVAKLEEMDLSLDEKRKVLATLKQTTKDSIDRINLPTEYITALEIQKSPIKKEGYSRGIITVDLTKDVEIYRGLDRLIVINPLLFNDEEKNKFSELGKICPQLMLENDLNVGQSTLKEYEEAEQWIEDVLQVVDPKWSDMQKIAYIDNAIGKKISYTPDFDTEICDQNAARALWKIISTGYGVCNGIAEVEGYMLGKIGIESERISTGKHAFLKLKNVEIPQADGSIAKGDTLIDPTWNLAAQRFGARPNLFCINYEQIRKRDIGAGGKDFCSHKNDEALSGVTLSLDDANLRKIYASIGLIKENGTFPIQDLIDKAKDIDNARYPSEIAIKKQLEILEEYYPDFAKCPNSTMAVLSSISLAQPNLGLKKCVVNRVYEKEDKSKTPVLYIYADLPEGGKKFFYVDKEKGKFIDLPPKEFEERFECYESDIAKNNGTRPWSETLEKLVEEDLNKSSGKVSQEGEAR